MPPLSSQACAWLDRSVRRLSTPLVRRRTTRLEVKLPYIRLYLSDLRNIVAVLRDCCEGSITLETPDCIFESVEDLGKLDEYAIRELTIRGRDSNVVIYFHSMWPSRIDFEQADRIPLSLRVELEQAIKRGSRPILNILAGVWGIVGLAIVAFVVFRVVRDWVGRPMYWPAGNVAAAGMWLFTVWYGWMKFYGPPVIMLAERRSIEGFWKRNRDVTIVILGAVAGAPATLVFQRWFNG